jgi:hypothetical protein
MQWGLLQHCTRKVEANCQADWSSCKLVACTPTARSPSAARWPPEPQAQPRSTHLAASSACSVRNSSPRASRHCASALLRAASASAQRSAATAASPVPAAAA